jgi:hypothetical protein
MSSSGSPIQGMAACPNCGDPLLSGKPYCANCGLLVGSTPDAIALRAYLDAKVASELNSRIKDNGGVVRELADKVEDVVWTRIKRYTVIALFFLAVITALVTFIGVKSYGDLKDSVVKQIQPAVSQIQSKATEVGAVVDDLKTKRIPEVTASLNQVQEEAASQKKRVEGADGQIEKSMGALRQAQAKAVADSEQFSNMVRENKQQLDQITQRSKDQIAQVTRAASQASVAQAYPSIGQEPQILIANQVASVKNKKLGEKWVSLVVSYAAIRENTYTKEQVEQVQSSLTAAGFRVLVGIVSVSGRINVGFERVGPDINALDSEVFYYDKSRSEVANEALSIASKIVNTLDAKPVLVEGSKEYDGVGAGIRYFEQNSGIDAQVFLGPEKSR